MVQIIHYRHKCIGCNLCVEVAFNRWRMSKKDGKSNLLGATEKKGIFIASVPNDELEQNRLAEQYCPVNIIKVKELN